MGQILAATQRKVLADDDGDSGGVGGGGDGGDGDGGSDDGGDHVGCAGGDVGKDDH